MCVATWKIKLLLQQPSNFTDTEANSVGENGEAIGTRKDRAVKNHGRFCIAELPHCFPAKAAEMITAAGKEKSCGLLYIHVPAVSCPVSRVQSCPA